MHLRNSHAGVNAFQTSELQAPSFLQGKNQNHGRIHYSGSYDFFSTRERPVPLVRYTLGETPLFVQESGVAAEMTHVLPHPDLKSAALFRAFDHQ